MTLREFRALGNRHRAAEQRLDRRAGVIASVIANTVRDPKQRREPYRPQDFFALDPPKPQPASSQTQIQAGWLDWAEQMRNLKRGH